VEPELISASGRDMATGLSGDAVGVDLLIRSGWTWRTILSVSRWYAASGIEESRDRVSGVSYSGVHCLAPSVGLLWNARLLWRSNTGALMHGVGSVKR
jgi:hypothetical protein